MKVLHLRSSGGFFGAEGVILNLCRESQALGVETHVLCLKNPTSSHGELVKEAGQLGLKAANVDCCSQVDVKTIIEIRDYIKNHKIDILHCHDYKADFFGLFAGLFLRVKRISTNHLWTSETKRLRFYEFLDGLLLNLFHKIIAVSDRIGEEVRALLVNKAKVSVIYNGINLDLYNPGHSAARGLREHFRIPDDKKIVGVVGRLSIQKGYVYFLEAAKLILKENSKIVFLIVGEGDLRGELEKQAGDLGISNDVIFAGIQKDMVQVYGALDVFVISSIDEGLPLVLLEALAMERPVVATNVGGIAKVVHSEQTGLLIPARDVDALVKGISSLLEDEARARRLAQNGRKLIEKKFAAKAMAVRYKEIYDQLVGL